MEATTEKLYADIFPAEKELIDLLVKEGAFKDERVFLNYAVKRTIAEIASGELDSMIPEKKASREEVDRIQNAIRKIRKELWSEKYAKGIC